MNVLPLPTSVTTRITPPCASTRARARARPIPSPPWRRPGSGSACRNRSKMCGSSSGGTPTPVSCTSIATYSPSGRLTTRPRSLTSPGASVNCTAFVSRFVITCCSRAGSTQTGGSDGGSSSTSTIPVRSSACRRSVASACRAITTMSASRRSSRSLPASRRLRSSRSSTIARSSSADWVITVNPSTPHSSCAAAASDCNRSAQSRIAVIGARSSCDSVARNASFDRFASSSRFTSRACSIATDAWSANRCRISFCSSTNGERSGPRTTINPPIVAWPFRSGTTIAERAGRGFGARRKHAGSRSSSDTTSPTPVLTTRPVMLPSSGRRLWRGRHSMPTTGPTSRSGSPSRTNAIPPPSAPVNRAAPSTTSWSTRSRSAGCAIARLISASAASSCVRCSSCRPRRASSSSR